MSYITTKGSFPNNPYLSTDMGHLILSCPSVVDALVLNLFQESAPYDRRIDGWARQDGRSLTGSNRIVGDQFKHTVMEASFLISLQQAQLFGQLLLAQDQGGIITIQDNLDNSGAALYFVQVEPTYLSVEPSLDLSWRRLQFTAEQEVV
jgi:hypothetical protein